MNLPGGGKYKTYDCRVVLIFSQVQLDQYHDFSKPLFSEPQIEIELAML